MTTRISDEELEKVIESCKMLARYYVSDDWQLHVSALLELQQMRKTHVDGKRLKDKIQLEFDIHPLDFEESSDLTDGHLAGWNEGLQTVMGVIDAMLKEQK